MIKKSTVLFFTALIACLLISFTVIQKKNLPEGYIGKPFHDDVYKAGAQTIPGKIQCAFYDLGGEGIAYHDTDSINKGSGEYNYQPGHCEPGSDYVCHFREKEGVDLSYTKEFLDFNHPNPFTPDRRQLYIGWAQNNEWCNYTVNVQKAGKYKVSILYSNYPCNFKLSVNNQNTGTYIAKIKTESFHTWNLADSVGTITFENRGLNLLTLHYNNGSNYAYLDFKLLQN